MSKPWDHFCSCFPCSMLFYWSPQTHQTVVIFLEKALEKERTHKTAALQPHIHNIHILGDTAALQETDPRIDGSECLLTSFSGHLSGSWANTKKEPCGFKKLEKPACTSMLQTKSLLSLYSCTMQIQQETLIFQFGCRPLPGSEKMIPRNRPAAVAHKSLGSSGEQQGPPLERELGQSQWASHECFESLHLWLLVQLPTQLANLPSQTWKDKLKPMEVKY